LRLRAKILAVTIAAVIATAAIGAALAIRQERARALNQFTENAIDVTSWLGQVIGNDLIKLDLRALRNVLASARLAENLTETYLLGRNGRVLGDGNKRTPLFDRPLSDPFAERVLMADGWIAENVGSMLKTGGPVTLADGRVLGYLVLYFSTEEMNQENARDARQILLFVSAFVLLGSVLAIAFASWVSQPVSAVAKAASLIGKGALTTRVSIDRSDEIGDLANAINAMASDLEAIIQERDRVADSLREARIAAESANRAKSEFLANMSHELRTPLNSINGFAEIIRDQSLGPAGASKYAEFAGLILDAGKHLLAVVNEVLDMSRIEAGRYVLHEDVIDPVAVIRSCMALVGGRAHEGSIELRDRTTASSPQIVADPKAMKQILLNLLSNSIKFTEPGGSVTVSAGLEPGGGWYLSVADTGIGIRAEDHEKIFDRFAQAEGTTSRRFGGAGLGLPISRKLMELHQGSLRIDHSAPGQGTTITARLPAARVVKSESTDAADAMLPPPKAARAAS